MTERRPTERACTLFESLNRKIEIKTTWNRRHRRPPAAEEEARMTEKSVKSSRRTVFDSIFNQSTVFDKTTSSFWEMRVACKRDVDRTPSGGKGVG